MTTAQALERVERERARAADARRALVLRAESLSELARGVHPLVLLGSVLAAGLLAGRVLGRPQLPRGLEPTAVVSGALQKSLAALFETFLAAALAPAPSSGDSTADSPPGTQSRSPRTAARG